MKIALKYGLLITAVVVAWVLIVRIWMGVGPDAGANIIAPILFNAAAIVAIFLGINERKKQLSGALGFKEGIKTGMQISLVYATSACLFFMVEYLVAGPKLLLSEAGGSSGPLWQMALLAYAGMFLGSLVLGLIYSTLTSFILARRQGREQTELF